MPESVETFRYNEKAQCRCAMARSEGESAAEEWRCTWQNGTETPSAVAELIRLTDYFRNVIPLFCRG